MTILFKRKKFYKPIQVLCEDLLHIVCPNRHQSRQRLREMTNHRPTATDLQSPHLARGLEVVAPKDDKQNKQRSSHQEHAWVKNNRKEKDRYGE